VKGQGKLNKNIIFESVRMLFTKKLSKLGDSVERIHLRQRSSDGSVNKTILKPRLALAARRHYVYVGFSRSKIYPDVKFRVAAQLAGSL